MDIITNAIIPLILMLGVLIGAHEFGHYLAARQTGVGIRRFSIGFGPVIAQKKDARGTEWAISLVPLGGYISMKEKTTEPEGKERAIQGLSYEETSRRQKAWIIAAGPLANIILGVALLLLWLGTAKIDATPPIVGEVIPNSPAERAGIRPGDQIIAIDNSPLYFFSDITSRLTISLRAERRFLILRENQILNLVVHPDITLQNVRGRQIERATIGIRSIPLHFRRAHISEIPHIITEKTWVATIGSLQVLGQVARGERRTDNLQGVVGLGETVSDASHDPLSLLLLAGLISLHLAIINLLPIPALDGGHLTILAIEAITKRPLPEKAKNWAMRAGLAAILCLFGFTILQDAWFIFKGANIAQ